MPSIWHVATHIDANASLISHTSMSSIVRPARSSTFGSATGMLVDGESRRRPVSGFHLDRNDLVEEAAVVDAGDRPLMRPSGPVVHLLAGHTRFEGGVPPDGDRHVHVRRRRRVAMARRQ